MRLTVTGALSGRLHSIERNAKPASHSAASAATAIAAPPRKPERRYPTVQATSAADTATVRLTRKTPPSGA